MITSIHDAFLGSGIKDWELAQVLLTYFKNAHRIAVDEIVYGYSGRNFAIKLKYKDDHLCEVSRGALLKEQDITALKGQIYNIVQSLQPYRFAHKIMFSNLPVNGWYKYKDIFQIMPLPADAARSPDLLGPHPFLLSFSFAGCSDTNVQSLRQAQVGQDLELVCTALLIYVAGSVSRNVRFTWTLSSDDAGQSFKTQRLQEGYDWHGLASLQRDAFPLVDNVPALQHEKPAKYYSLWAISANQGFTVPTIFGDLLDVFFSLNKTARERFLRACFWFRHANDVRFYSQSASYVALIAAIESLLPGNPDKRKCPTCYQETGSGPTQRFSDFVDKYVPSQASTEKERKEFYRIRSKLVHGGALLMQDERVYFVMNPKWIKENNTLMTMQQLVRIALANWLFDKEAHGEAH